MVRCAQQIYLFRPHPYVMFICFESFLLSSAYVSNEAVCGVYSHPIHAFMKLIFPEWSWEKKAVDSWKSHTWCSDKQGPKIEGYNLLWDLCQLRHLHGERELTDNRALRSKQIESLSTMWLLCKVRGFQSNMTSLLSQRVIHCFEHGVDETTANDLCSPSIGISSSIYTAWKKMCPEMSISDRICPL
jgi:hypothetical protein